MGATEQGRDIEVASVRTCQLEPRCTRFASYRSRVAARKFRVPMTFKTRIVSPVDIRAAQFISGGFSTEVSVTRSAALANRVDQSASRFACMRAMKGSYGFGRENLRNLGVSDKVLNY
jgi:hypothetical protein